MNCPKCGFEQHDGVIECGKCGIIMAKAMRSPARPAPTASPAPVSPSAEPAPSTAVQQEQRPAPLVLISFILISLIALAWWLNFPSPSDLPADAYVNVKHQFAFAPPRDWLQLTPENYERIIEEYKDRFPGELRSLIANPGFEVSFVRVPNSQNEFAPSFNVVVIPLKQDLPPLTGSEKDEAAKSISREFRKQVKYYTMESSSIVDVDSLPSLQIIGSAPLTVVLEPSKPIMSAQRILGMQQVIGHTQEVNRTFTLKTTQFMVPGRKRLYVISYTAEESDVPAFGPVFNSVTRSFRVMDRPPRFGPVTMGALNGALFGAGLYLLYIFIGRVMIALRKGHSEPS